MPVQTRSMCRQAAEKKQMDDHIDRLKELLNAAEATPSDSFQRVDAINDVFDYLVGHPLSSKLLTTHPKLSRVVRIKVTTFLFDGRASDELRLTCMDMILRFGWDRNIRRCLLQC